MASKNLSQTPKKFYGPRNTSGSSSCRLCQSVGDTSHWKNLFSKTNRPLLSAVEELSGTLPRNEFMAHLVCRPCERRITNFKTFKDKILSSQAAYKQRCKRCIEVSPSAPRILKSSKAADETARPTSRRGLAFSTPDRSSKEVQDSLPSDSDQLESVVAKIGSELTEIARRSTKSVLRERDFAGLSNVDFAEIVSEIKTLCPIVYSLLSGMLEMNIASEKKTATLALIYSLIMFRRCHELSRVQRVNTVLLCEGDANQEVIQRFGKYGICLDKSTKYPLLDEIGGHFLDQAVELVRRGRKFVFVLDNIDWVVKAHDMRSDKQNKSVHGVATSLVFDRVQQLLPDCGPQQNLANCDMRVLITPSDAENAETKERYKILLARLLCKLPAFHFLSDIVPPHLPVQYRDEMGMQSDVIPMPVLMKDEKKYADVIDVLDQLETWLHEIYSKAGLCAPPVQDNAPPGPPIEAPSRPDQPAAHLSPEPHADDPLAGIKVPCFGDQLTRVRFAGAKDLRAGTHTAKDRLDHLYPFRIVDWHSKRSFLKLIFKKLYKNSGREIGTLRYFRDKLQRRNVTIDVKHFEDCEQLFLSVGKCFTMEALLQFFHMETEDDRPTRNCPPYHLLYGEDNKRQYLDITLEAFLDEYLMPPLQPPAPQRPAINPAEEDAPHNNVDEDHIRNYSLCILKYYFILLDFKDAVKEGNGERLVTLHKQFLLHFKSESGFNAYSIEMLISIVQNKVFLSESEAHQCKWASTVNWKGGSSKNVEIDLLQENRNKDIKKLIKGMGANKTDKAIERASRAAGGVRKIVENFDSQVSLSPSSSHHSHKSSAGDETKISRDLQQLRPFLDQPGRSHNSFPDVGPDPLGTVDDEELVKWLTRHQRNLLLHGPLGQDADDG